MAELKVKGPMLELKVPTALPLEKNDGAMVFILRADSGAEVHFPQLGRLSEGQIERYQMQMYRGLMEARARMHREQEKNQ